MTEFDHLLVIDFGAPGTSRDSETREIVEFPIVVVDVRRKEVLNEEFHHYVRPTRHLKLSQEYIAKCGIEQHMVDGAETIEAVVNLARAFVAKLGLDETRLAVVTCGNYDLGTALKAEATNKTFPLPAWLRRWVSLKETFGAEFGEAEFRKSRRGQHTMVTMMQTLRLPLNGRHHSGIDDARNIAKIVLKLLEREVPLKITGSYEVSDSGGVPASSTTEAAAGQSSRTSGASTQSDARSRWGNKRGIGTCKVWVPVKKEEAVGAQDEATTETTRVADMHKPHQEQNDKTRTAKLSPYPASMANARPPGTWKPKEEMHGPVDASDGQKQEQDSKKKKKTPEEMGFQARADGKLFVRAARSCAWWREVGPGLQIGSLEKPPEDFVATPSPHAELEVLGNRQTLLGNPFHMQKDEGLRDNVCDAFASYLDFLLAYEGRAHAGETVLDLWSLAVAIAPGFGLDPSRHFSFDWRDDFGRHRLTAFCTMLGELRSLVNARGLGASNSGCLRLLCHCAPKRCHLEEIAGVLMPKPPPRQPSASKGHPLNEKGEEESAGCVMLRRRSARVASEADGSEDMVEGSELEALLILRGANYELPKGHLEGSETARQAARRELGEEAGVEGQVIVGPRLGVSKYTLRSGTPKVVSFFAAWCVPAGASPKFGNREKETKELRWVSAKELPQIPLKAEEMRAFLAKALELPLLIQPPPPLRSASAQADAAAHGGKPGRRWNRKGKGKGKSSGKGK